MIPAQPSSANQRDGVGLGLAAYVIWGLAPLFWKLLGDAPPLEQALQRLIWAVPLLGIVVWFVRRNIPKVPRRTIVAMALAGSLLVANWAIFLWAVTAERVTETSLGYFINPLLAVAAGVFFLGEKIGRLQRWALLPAGLGVLWLAVRAEQFPWVAITLAVSFALYGVVKKRTVRAGAFFSVFAELAWFWPAALIVWLVQAVNGSSSFGTDVSGWLFVASGLVTVAPLVLWGAAAGRIPLGLVGMLQYIAPTISFLLGVFVFDEAFGNIDLVGYALVWVGAALYLIGQRRGTKRLGDVGLKPIPKNVR